MHVGNDTELGRHELVRHLKRRRGWCITIAATSVGVVQQCANGKVDVLFISEYLGNPSAANGFEVAKRIREVEALS